MEDFKYFKGADVSGFTLKELDAVAQLVDHPGWLALKKFIGALMEPVSPAVYSNTDPLKQNLLHQGIGAIYVASNIEKFVSSAKSTADRLVQQEASADEAAKQAKENEV